jgi:alanine racemase
LKYTIQNIANICGGQLQLQAAATIEQLVIDSRKVYFPASSLFVAIVGVQHDGHTFIPSLYEKGVRNFMVSEAMSSLYFKDANYITVQDTSIALQQLAAAHRHQYHYPIIGITGSNGKTIVKEWLFQLLHAEYNIVRSPRSYNSQVGVPLSVIAINEQHNLGIFEAGISLPNEMSNLEHIIQPKYGILTNIGSVHDEGFPNREAKIKEFQMITGLESAPE